MSWEEFEDMLTQTVCIYPKSGTDKHGMPTHSSTPKTIKARIQGRSDRTFFVDNKQVTARYKLILGTTDAISPEDKLTLPSGYYPTNPPVLGVYPVDDEDGGRSHYEMWLG